MILSRDVSVQTHDGVQVVNIKGEVTSPMVGAVRAAVRTALSTGSGPVVIDLSQTTYLDSVGVRMLFDVAADLSAEQRPMGLIVPRGALIRKVLTITKFDERVPVYDSLEEATRNRQASIDPDVSPN